MFYRFLPDTLNKSSLWMYKPAFEMSTIDNIVKALLPCEEQLGKALVGGVQSDESPGVLNENLRRTGIYFIDYRESSFQNLFHTINSYSQNANNSNFGFSLTYTEPLQYGVYKADSEDMYDWHCDQGAHRDKNNNVRKLSFSLLLSEPGVDFEGGEFEVMEGADPYDAKLEKGTLVYFPSFLMHRVKPVTKGIRRSLVGWINGPNWV